MARAHRGAEGGLQEEGQGDTGGRSSIYTSLPGCGRMFLVVFLYTVKHTEAEHVHHLKVLASK